MTYSIEEIEDLGEQILDSAEILSNISEAEGGNEYIQEALFKMFNSEDLDKINTIAEKDLIRLLEKALELKERI